MCTDKDDPNKEKNMAASYAEAAKGDNTQSQAYDDKMTGVKPIFLLEEDVFGNNLVSSNGQRYFLTHHEVYHAINEQVPVKSLSGLQRVRGIWRIYFDNEMDKKDLLSKGVTIRRISVTLYTRNPKITFREQEDTIRVRVKNIPLSADDNQIIRTLETSVSKCEVLSCYRERLRIDNKITNCKNGDRILICKTFEQPLPKTMQVGKYWANINHYGQPHTTRPSTKCSKCLDEGHTARECPNGWKCKKCGQFGHKQFECTENMNSDSEVNDDGDEMNNTFNKENHDDDDDDDDESNDDCTGENNQSLEEGNSQNITKPSMSIEESKKTDNNPEQSQSILETQSVLSKKQQGQTPKNNKNTGHKESITRYLSTKGRDQDSTNNINDTPKQLRNKNPNVEKSPVTPTENLHDATRDAKKPKKRR
ncbi:unnamed protein product [Mytilus edulis]|uniref:CCHC-type domain-containing protein n=3 Tax=Mytilus edulis TaxID=6550 RepID=A0A8S3RN88_MYTED|nr:unnamed protein product [Mytilus edulis]